MRIRRFALAAAAWLLASSAALAWPELRIEKLTQALQASVTTADYKFAIVGDSRGGPEILAAQLKGMKARGAAFALHGGDIIGVADDQYYALAKKLIKDSPLPVLMVQGNHDLKGWRGQETPYFVETYGQPDWSFDLGGVRFIALDNARGLLSKAQLQWLDKQLQTPLKKVVLAHMPPPIGTWEHGFYYGAPEFMALVEKRKVDYAVFSHIHFYDHAARNGVRYVVTGGGGAPIYRFPLNAKDGGHYHHYLMFELKGGQLKYSVVRS